MTTNQETILEALDDAEEAIVDAILTFANLDDDPSIAPTSISYVAGYVGAALAAVRRAREATEFVKDKPDGYVAKS